MNFLLTLFSLLLGSSFIGGCTYGPKQKDKSLLESLNGRHYETAPQGNSTSIGSIPIVKRRRANVRISGRLFLTTSTSGPLLPLSGQEIELIQGTQTLAAVRSDSSGSFNFIGDFEDGDAKLRLHTSKFAGEHTFQIKGFEMTGVDLHVRSKDTQ